MPPKKGKKDKGRGKSNVVEDTGPAVPSEKEIKLQQELDALQVKLELLKVEVEKLRKENDFLQQEALQTRTESNEYMSFMAKKTNKRQSAIITLSDQNEHELKKLELEKKELKKNFEERKYELKEQLLDKEKKLKKAKSAYLDLAQYKALRDEQLDKIKQLEQQLTEKRAEYSDKLQEMKTSFLSERAKFTSESEERVKSLSNEAKKKAVVCLGEHASAIKEENKNLRAELTELLKQSSLLTDHKQRLEKQHVELLREQQYSNDILRLRGEKQTRAMERQAAEKKNTKQQRGGAKETSTGHAV